MPLQLFCLVITSLSSSCPGSDCLLCRLGPVSSKMLCNLICAIFIVHKFLSSTEFSSKAFQSQISKCLHYVHSDLFQVSNTMQPARLLIWFQLHVGRHPERTLRLASFITDPAMYPLTPCFFSSYKPPTITNQGTNPYVVPYLNSSCYP